MSASTSATDSPPEAAGAGEVPGDGGLALLVRDEVTTHAAHRLSRPKRRFICSIRKASATSGGRSAKGTCRLSARLRGTVVSTGASKAAETSSAPVQPAVGLLAQERQAGAEHAGRTGGPG